MNIAPILWLSGRRTYARHRSWEHNGRGVFFHSSFADCEDNSLSRKDSKRHSCRINSSSKQIRVQHGTVCHISDPNAPMAQCIQRAIKHICTMPYRFGRRLPDGREELVLLGTGWAALYFLSQIDPRYYKVTVISPRPYFVFTPLLTAALGGVQSMRSIMEPIRNKLKLGPHKAMDFVQSVAQDVDLVKREVECQALDGSSFRIPYDRLVVAIGSETNTFGIPGVKEHCSFLKEIEDVREIRLRLFNAFEKAALPGTSDNEKKALLSFVVVGGGPAGVEAAAEMNDLIKRDLKQHFPHLSSYASVSVIEMLPKLLPMFDESISKYTAKEFNKNGIQALLEHRVTKIDDHVIHLSDKSGDKTIPYGFCIWASGVGQVPLAQKLLAKIPAQKGNRVMRVDPTLRVLGDEKIYAVGDCAWVTPPTLSQKADIIYQAAKKIYFRS
eukprot:Gregarina_sp_Poly_1__9705@NODE_616_length_7127_cov_52_867989_g472_i0_p2_GENE_NODE_616_length_7127_cov_52_867989_g472_i0NODE_616_length_7127_cov_52_867989_g472_i0_p2_ORF_typecomplete_len452_score45_73Pyr_redox_2/PF07992_14/7_6e49Pyr_redox/PF00070_27/1_6e03Pyr_redox/PF00070_27/9_6e15Pyr_redox_3/PF13738_6/0_19Pyr_redox_3/PF13738_6/0_19HI0933_like/PF03486_14/1_6e03HI0933_like/PF03486_14/0_86HI0933_like/PF03486_14/11Lycopene_cycl/PF05834_12/1_1e02Lycopene_cycl/PF05834_12/0_18Thi4/PF01946_17/0_013GIDA